MDWRLGTGGEGERRCFAGSEDRERMAGSFGVASARVRIFNLFCRLATGDWTAEEGGAYGMGREKVAGR